MSGLHTVSTIAQRFAESIYTIDYLLRTRGIPPSGRAGIARIYDDKSVARIEHELRQLRKNRHPLQPTTT